MELNIRNLVVIAHIDHGKSTLADRMLEITGTVETRLMKPQYLDSLELERERGITIKMAPVRMNYEYSGRDYILNLIDTPGHSDFSYEVSRALAAVEGAILLVDATQGIQAQTLANFENAKKANLKIIGAVNKVDAANKERISETVKEVSELIGADENEILKVSGKTGEGVEELLKRIISEIPEPKIGKSDYSRALIFDSFYHDHKGIIAFVRVFDGKFEQAKGARLFATNAEFKIKEIGFFAPELKISGILENGNIGYIATGLKDSDKLKIGDTIGIQTHKSKIEPLLGYEEVKPVVFVSFYPEESGDYDDLKQALGQLKLNDSALFFEPDFNQILGRGFKGGFLGRLHFEITADRLAREFKINTVHSFPSVSYQIKLRNDGWLPITNPKDFTEDVVEVLEPMTKIEILTPPEYLGPVLQLKEFFRFDGIEVKTSGNKALITAKLPLADLISDLDDKLKSVSEGFASLSYEMSEMERADLEKMEILVASHIVPGLTRIIPKKFSTREARRTVEKLRELLPRQQFAQAIQARVSGRIVARETIPALRKDVTGYLYGGDRTRKMKLWKKQQKGKKRLKEMSVKQQVKIPANIFKELLKK